MENSVQVATPTMLVLIINGAEVMVDMAMLGLTIDSSNNDILRATEGQLIEMNQPVSDLMNLYKVHKAFDSNRVFIIPNSAAGKII